MKTKKRVLTIVAIMLSAVFFASCGTSEETETAEFAQNDMYLSIGDTGISVEENIESIVSVLGEPTDYSEAPSCAFDGMDKIYTYPGITFYTYPSDEEDYVLEIVLDDETYQTLKGAQVGMSLDEITAIYGEGYESNGNYIMYYANETEYMYCYMNGETVTSIGFVTMQ
jgi:hypothetical protein